MSKIQNFQKIVIEMIDDLNRTFPECHLCQWTELEGLDSKIIDLYDYSFKVFPERFFDIIYQNNDIFSKTSVVNTFFLPEMDFKYFFQCDNVSDSTKQTIWNYLKAILILLVNDTTDKSIFGDTSSTFTDIDENGLFEKLKDTMTDLSKFLEKKQNEENNDHPVESSNDDSDPSNENEIPGNLPNINDFFSHIGEIFEGKIGLFAKELAEEFTKDIQGIIGEENINDIKGPADIMKTLFKDPAKFSELMKSVVGKFQGKMDSGEFTKEDVMKETSDIMNKMKSAGNMDYNDIMKYVSQMMKPQKSENAPKSSFSTTREKLKKRVELRNAQLQKVKDTKNETILPEIGNYDFTLLTDNEKQQTTSINSKKKKPKNKKK